MKLKFSYDNIEDIPEAFRELYTERDGKWEFTGVEGIKTQTDVDRVSEALRKERDGRKEAEAKLKKFGEMDPDSVYKDLDELQELRTLKEAGDLDGDKLAEKIEAGVNARMAREINPLKRQIETLTTERDEARAGLEEKSTELTNRDIDTKLREFATKAGVVPEHHDDVLVRRGLFEIGEDGKVVLKESGLTPDLWLEDMKPNKPGWFGTTDSGRASGGGGNKGATGNNPFAPKSRNLTRAMEIVKKDPDKAAQLAGHAGFASVDAALAAMAAGV